MNYWFTFIQLTLEEHGGELGCQPCCKQNSTCNLSFCPPYLSFLHIWVPYLWIQSKVDCILLWYVLLKKIQILVTHKLLFEGQLYFSNEWSLISSFTFIFSKDCLFTYFFLLMSCYFYLFASEFKMLSILTFSLVHLGHIFLGCPFGFWLKHF